MGTIILETDIQRFRDYLIFEEKSANTIDKYVRDVRVFADYAGGREIDKAVVLAYKEELLMRYTVTSANSMLAAINSFFRFMGWDAYRVRQFKIQRSLYRSSEKELTKAEYVRLVKTAKKRGDQRLWLLLQTIGSTGIRISELAYITVEAARRGEARVRCKGKTRVVFIVKELARLLLVYAASKGIKRGAVFVSANGKPLDRSNVWRAMKQLCEYSGVSKGKVFPHNLRHLFARLFYKQERDLSKLADVLGHASINTTRIYIIATGIEHRRIMERVSLLI